MISAQLISCSKLNIKNWKTTLSASGHFRLRSPPCLASNWLLSCEIIRLLRKRDNDDKPNYRPACRSLRSVTVTRVAPWVFLTQEPLPGIHKEQKLHTSYQRRWAVRPDLSVYNTRSSSSSGSTASSLTTICWVQSTLSSHQRSWGGKSIDCTQ